jgi:hypothetical protein
MIRAIITIVVVAIILYAAYRMLRTDKPGSGSGGGGASGSGGASPSGGSDNGKSDRPQDMT